MLCVVGVAGCDIAYGVSRRVEVQRLPSEAAVESALRDVPEIRTVERSLVESYKGWSPVKGMVTTPGYVQWLYGTGSPNESRPCGVLTAREKEDGSRVVELYWTQLNRRPSRELIADTRRLMDMVYANLHRRVPDLPPPSRIGEQLLNLPVEWASDPPPPGASAVGERTTSAPPQDVTPYRTSAAPVR